MHPKRSGNSGRYFRVRNWLSEYGLSFETCGRLCVLVTPFGQKTRRGQSPTEQSRFLFLINVSASVAFNQLVVEPLYDLGPIEELCNQGENPKQNHHCHASRA